MSHPLFDDPLELDEEQPAPLDPHDRHADPERTARVSTRWNQAERDERHADGVLSDFGRAILHSRWGRERD